MSDERDPAGDAGRWEYEGARTLPDGRVIGLFRFIFTVGLCVDIDVRHGHYASRYCYADGADALRALMAWDGVGDPPGPWIKHKGGPTGDRSNPNRTTIGGVPVVRE